MTRVICHTNFARSYSVLTCFILYMYLYLPWGVECLWPCPRMPVGGVRQDHGPGKAVRCHSATVPWGHVAAWDQWWWDELTAGHQEPWQGKTTKNIIISDSYWCDLDHVTFIINPHLQYMCLCVILLSFNLGKIAYRLNITWYKDNPYYM